MLKKNVTMSDIAKALNVSTVTVSKALGGREGVSEALRERIKRKAEDMGYKFRRGENVFPEGSTYNIGIVVEKSVFGDPSSLCWELYRNIVELLRKQNFYGMLEVFDGSGGAAELPSVLKDEKVDGLILLGQFPGEYIERLEEFYVPVVFLDQSRSRTDSDMIISDSFFGGYTLTSYLILNGHRRIGFIGDINGSPGVRERYLGFYKALLENHLVLRNEWVFSVDPHHFGAFELPAESPSGMPTAFVCGNDETAYRLVNLLADNHISVPENISVVGYDNHTYSTMCRPHLTTMDINSPRLAEEAVDMLLHKIRDRGFSGGIKLVAGKLVRRDSVKNLLA